MKTYVVCLALAVLIGAPVHVHAEMYNQTLDFIAGDQSIWGPGGSSAGFGSSGSTSLGPADFSYSVGANSGTVSGRFKGNMSINYVSSLAAPGATSVHLGFLGDINGGRIKSDLGAWVNVSALGFDVLDEGYGLNIDKSSTPKIQRQVYGSDSTTVGGAGVNIYVAKVGADFDIEQTDRFVAKGIDGFLVYGQRGSGVTSSRAFSLDSDIGLNLDLDLAEAGIWDFKVADVNLANEFAASYDAELVLYEEHTEVVWDWLDSRVVTRRNDMTLADFDVYSGSPFALDFNEIDGASGFSIEVIPEPRSIAMIGLVSGCAVFVRRRFMI
jgi:hypothetical protein